MQPTDSVISFVVPGDLHLTHPGLENHRTAVIAVDEINNWIQPDFVQFIGDNVQDATEAQFRLFDDLRSKLKVPHFALVGDHDVHDDPEARRFQEFVGSPFGAHSLGGYRFIRLNTQEARPLGIGKRQLDWFAAQVDEAISNSERIVVFQHNYPYQIWETFEGPGIDRWREVVQTRRVEAIIAGHTHYLQFANDGRNITIATRSIGEPEGGPPGYLVGAVQGDYLAARYRPTGERAPLVLIFHPREAILATRPHHVVCGPDRIDAKVWGRSPIDAVRRRVDEGDWIELGSKSDGRWSGPMASDSLSKGEHVLEVRAVDSDGREGSQRIDFVVDPTRRFTAVPSVRPRVASTAFC